MHLINQVALPPGEEFPPAERNRYLTTVMRGRILKMIPILTGTVPAQFRQKCGAIEHKKSPTDNVVRRGAGLILD